MTSINVNRDHWNRASGDYQELHGPQIGAAARLWGMFSLPDADLGALGDVTGKSVLELGCGAAQWSRSLAGEAGHLVGFDLSEAQLAAARRPMGTPRFRLRHDYFGLGPIPDEDGAVSYTLSYGGWVRVLVGAGLVIDDLIEPRPDPQAPSTYFRGDPPDWASRWPCEIRWVTHKPWLPGWVGQLSGTVPISASNARARRPISCTSVFQVLTFGLLGWFYLDILPGWLGTASRHFSLARIVVNVLIFLGIPLLAGFLTRTLGERARGRGQAPMSIWDIAMSTPGATR